MKKLLLFTSVYLWALYNGQHPHSMNSLFLPQSSIASAPLVANSLSSDNENADVFVDELFSTETVQPVLHCEKKWGAIYFQGKPFQRYRIRANQFPEGKRFTLFVKWFNGDEVEVASYIANARGHLHLDKQENDPVFALCPLKKGERIEFLMKSAEDPSFYAQTSLIPFPLELKAKKKLELALELSGKDGDAFRLQAKGLNSAEAVELITVMQDVETTYSLEASDQGTLDFPLKLDMGKEETAECVLKLIRGDQEFNFPFQAGTAALELAGGFVLEIR